MNKHVDEEVSQLLSEVQIFKINCHRLNVAFRSVTARI